MTDYATEHWRITYNQLELQFDKGSFDTWLRGAEFLRKEGNTYYIGVRNEYARDMLQYRLYGEVQRVLCEVAGAKLELQFEIQRPRDHRHNRDEEMPLFRLLAEQSEDFEDAGPLFNTKATQVGESDPTDVADENKPVDDMALHQRIKRPQRQSLPESELNPRLTFDRFIVNGSNRMTYEAARAVAENAGKVYNPFLIYGGVGLGKTHLLHAIAHECQARGLYAIYVPSEAFTNDLVSAIRSKTTAMFRDRYRSVDVLLVDDIQFIAGKESTQEEFFHTFNTLYTFNKQIVLASDRHPRELTTLEDRLRSRFEGGLLSDVGPLEFESRLAILDMWAAERDTRLDRGVLQMIASRSGESVRELEGVFNQVVAQAMLTRGPFTLDSAEFTLDRFDRPREHFRPRINPEKIIEMTACHFRLKSADLTSKKRASRINQARQVAMYLVRELTEFSLPQIGEMFGGRSHTTVLHGCNKIADEVEFDPSLRQRIDQIRLLLEGE